MTLPIFESVPLVQRSFLQKLLGQHPEENAVIELNNMLASKPVQAISQNDIASIESRYGVKLQQEFQLNLEEFYAVYLNACLCTKGVNSEERRDLAHLQALFTLGHQAVTRLHNSVGAIFYRKSWESTIANGRLMAGEQAYLEKLEVDLNLPKEVATKISEETRAAFVQTYVAKIIEDERLSPDEERELQAVSTSLHVTLQFNDQIKQKLQRLKLYWALEHLDLPLIQASIILQKSEECYMEIGNVAWYELRKARQSRQVGYSTKLRVAKGFYLHASSHTTLQQSTSEMTYIDRGTIYLTNKRIIFTGDEGNKNIRLEKILNLTPLSNGVEIDKETGKSPTLVIPERTDIFCMILERILRER